MYIGRPELILHGKYRIYLTSSLVNIRRVLLVTIESSYASVLSS